MTIRIKALDPVLQGLETEYKTQITITKEVEHNIEYYRGIVEQEDRGIVYEITRMSESGIKQALLQYLLMQRRLHNV